MTKKEREVIYDAFNVILNGLVGTVNYDTLLEVNVELAKVLKIKKAKKK